MLFFQDSETLKSTDKICRQLIYHLTPHSKWLRKSMTRRKAQAWWETFSVLQYMASKHQNMLIWS